MKNLYLSLEGIPTEAPEKSGDLYFYRDPQGAWYPNKGNHLYEIDAVCVRLHDGFAQRVFGTLGNFYDFLKVAPEFLSTAGMNSEAAISKDLFNQLLENIPPSFSVNRALYLFDCRKLVSGVQECSKEVMQLQGEFYQALNLEDLFFPKIEEDDGIRYVTSPVVTKIYALLGFTYIRMHSLLDYVTKLAIEIDKLKTKFDSYPRLASKNALYRDRKRISINNKAGTLFEKCPTLTEVESVRNHLIHNGLLDDMPKAYRVISNGECVEKFLLFPDQDKDGRFDSFKNRNFFYGSENKINLRLPSITVEFQVRLLSTLELLIKKLTDIKTESNEKKG
jgi:hypothetical protein